MADELQQIALRIPQSILDRADTLSTAMGSLDVAADLLGERGMTRTDVLRTALRRGIESLEQKYLQAAPKVPAVLRHRDGSHETVEVPAAEAAAVRAGTWTPPVVDPPGMDPQDVTDMIAMQTKHAQMESAGMLRPPREDMPVGLDPVHRAILDDDGAAS